jgi:hypothetical protein
MLCLVTLCAWRGLVEEQSPAFHRHTAQGFRQVPTPAGNSDHGPGRGGGGKVDACSLASPPSRRPRRALPLQRLAGGETVQIGCPADVSPQIPRRDRVLRKKDKVFKRIDRPSQGNRALRVSRRQAVRRARENQARGNGSTQFKRARGGKDVPSGFEAPSRQPGDRRLRCGPPAHGALAERSRRLIPSGRFGPVPLDWRTVAPQSCPCLATSKAVTTRAEARVYPKPRPEPASRPPAIRFRPPAFERRGGASKGF